jgi:hypothetical protein
LTKSFSKLHRIELFKHLRSTCNNQNPHQYGLVNTSASSFDGESKQPQNLLNLNYDAWWSEDEPNQWLLFDLKQKSFIIQAIRIHIAQNYILRHWSLLVSNDNLSWTTLFDQGEDERCNTDDNTVNYDIQTQLSFFYFKFVQLDKCYDDRNGIRLYDIEFRGILIE